MPMPIPIPMLSSAMPIATPIAVPTAIHVLIAVFTIVALASDLTASDPILLTGGESWQCANACVSV